MTSLALCQINTVVGDVAGNLRKVMAALEQAAARNVAIVVLPELALVGYPPRDLLERRALTEAARRGLMALAKQAPTGMAVVVGSIDWPSASPLPRNVAHLVRDGEVETVAKRLLPTYDVFDEARHFTPGPSDQPAVFEIGGAQAGILVCEDLWNDAELWGTSRRYPDDPAEELAQAGAELLIVLSASPFDSGKTGVRARLVRQAARRHGVGVAMCNLVGGNDSLVFDGASMLANPGGRLVAIAEPFAEDFLVADWTPGGFSVDSEQAAARARRLPDITLDPEPCRVELDPDALDEIERALCLGLRDYVDKQGFERVVLGLSGGIDSALTAYLGARVLGGRAVTAIEMPSRHTSELSRTIAANLIETLGLEAATIGIEPVQQAFVGQLAPLFGSRPPGVAEENIQARVRGSLLMAVSNKLGHLVLATGNKSEMAVGYCTLYGDMNGGLAVISDVLKLQVYALARRINEREGQVIPPSVIDRAPTAELRADQTDQDSLPSYEELDPILVGLIEDRLEDHEIAQKTGSPASLVQRVRGMVERAEFKRHQAAPTLRISRRAWHGRRYPIVQRFRPNEI